MTTKAFILRMCGSVRGNEKLLTWKNPLNDDSSGNEQMEGERCRGKHSVMSKVG